MSTTGEITTAEQLLHATGQGRCELVRGELARLPFYDFSHSRISASLLGRLVDFAHQHRLGLVLGPGTGFHLARDPDTVRAPDVAFVRAERVPPGSTAGFFPGAPDLAVEVLSPGDRASEVLAKVRDWQEAGCQVVWVVDPQTQTVTVYRGRSEVVLLGASDTLTQEDLLPGLRLPVAEIFAR